MTYFHSMCQLEMMAYAAAWQGWPRSCQSCSIFGPCHLGYRQETTETGFDIVDRECYVVARYNSQSHGWESILPRERRGLAG